LVSTAIAVSVFALLKMAIVFGFTFFDEKTRIVRKWKKLFKLKFLAKIIANAFFVISHIFLYFFAPK
jgi:hypothetical protein